MKKLLVALVVVLLAGPALADRGVFDLDRWHKILNEIQERAVAEKVDAQTINAVIQNAVFFPDALHRDQNQSEFKMTMDGYLSRTVNPARIADGRKKAAEYPTLLRKTHEAYGVQPHVILAFWGLESNYGAFRATHKLSDAFLTLIYDGRREKFFADQLIALMKIADAGKMPVSELYGSWAGAMGHFQFIPATWLQYAVDGNGDGKINMIATVSDAFASAGNYLNKLGWNQNERIVREVSLPNTFDLSVCDAKTKKSLADWAKLGVTNPNETAIPTHADMMAGIVCDMNKTDGANVSDSPPGSGGDAAAGADSLNAAPGAPPRIRAFLAYDNFYRIKKWNNSNYYAVAIALMADALK